MGKSQQVDLGVAVPFFSDLIVAGCQYIALARQLTYTYIATNPCEFLSFSAFHPIIYYSQKTLKIKYITVRRHSFATRRQSQCNRF